MTAQTWRFELARMKLGILSYQVVAGTGTAIPTLKTFKLLPPPRAILLCNKFSILARCTYS